MGPTTILQQRADEIVSQMTSMITSEVTYMHSQKRNGRLTTESTTGEVRHIVANQNGRSIELILRPQYVFGDITKVDYTAVTSQFSRTKKLLFEQLVDMVSIRASNPLVTAAIKMLEPECQEIKNSKILRCFAAISAAYFISDHYQVAAL